MAEIGDELFAHIVRVQGVAPLTDLAYEDRILFVRGKALLVFSLYTIVIFDVFCLGVVLVVIALGTLGAVIEIDLGDEHVAIGNWGALHLYLGDVGVHFRRSESRLAGCAINGKALQESLDIRMFFSVHCGGKIVGRWNHDSKATVGRELEVVRIPLEVLEVNWIQADLVEHRGFLWILREIPSGDGVLNSSSELELVVHHRDIHCDEGYVGGLLALKAAHEEIVLVPVSEVLFGLIALNVEGALNYDVLSIHSLQYSRVVILTFLAPGTAVTH